MYGGRSANEPWRYENCTAEFIVKSMTWDYAAEEYEKQAAADEQWHLERLINYGLGNEKLRRDSLERHLATLRIPEERRAFLELLLWEKKS